MTISTNCFQITLCPSKKHVTFEDGPTISAQELNQFLITTPENTFLGGGEHKAAEEIIRKLRNEQYKWLPFERDLSLIADFKQRKIYVPYKKPQKIDVKLHFGIPYAIFQEALGLPSGNVVIKSKNRSSDAIVIPFQKEPKDHVEQIFQELENVVACSISKISWKGPQLITQLKIGQIDFNEHGAHK